MHLRPILFSLVLLFTFQLCHADSTGVSEVPQELTRKEKRALRRAEKEKKNLRFSVLGGPGYTSDLGFLLGGSLLFTFRTDSTDTLLPRSVVPVAFSIYSSGGLKFRSKSELYYNENRFRIFTDLIVSTLPQHYFGVGYQTNNTTLRSDSTTRYQEKLFQVKPSFSFRLAQSSLFIGPILDVAGRTIEDPSQGVQDDPHYQGEGGDSTGLTLWSSGLGFQMQYDTRDVVANAYKGILLDVKLYGYMKWLGSSSNFGALELEYRQFKELPIASKRKVFAWTAYGRQVLGEAPFTELSTVGSMYDLRGYAEGQYRDQAVLYAMGEYRHMFNAGTDTKAQRFWSRFGFVLWGGVGAIGPNLFHYDGALPNYGAGLRIELQPRMNFRIDVGRDPLGKETLVYLNVTEAF